MTVKATITDGEDWGKNYTEEFYVYSRGVLTHGAMGVSVKGVFGGVASLTVTKTSDVKISRTNITDYFATILTTSGKFEIAGYPTENTWSRNKITETVVATVNANARSAFIFNEGSEGKISCYDFSNNDADSGGAITVNGGSLIIENTNFSGCKSNVGGGAITANDALALTVKNSTFTSCHVSHPTNRTGTVTGGAVCITGDNNTDKKTLEKITIDTVYISKHLIYPISATNTFDNIFR